MAVTDHYFILEMLRPELILEVSPDSCLAMIWILISPSAPTDEFLALTVRPGLPRSFSMFLEKDQGNPGRTVRAKNSSSGAEGEIN